ncbi:MAG: VacJ family lipoprotein [Gammaproteobacteria bacterium]|nr:VacJ family lipoprotein [Gammaproteobacteria bacterium]
MHYQFYFALILLCLLTLSGCATLDGPTEPQDPWEGFNRSMYTFNNKVDRAILKPVAKGYRAITPNAVEKGVSNFFSNLWEIKVIANDALQFKLLRALSDSGRFLVNSTIGIGGLFDVATHMGLKKHDEDFGQTLGRWGIGNGPYLVLPFFGPSSIRDGVGLVGDYQLDPIKEVEDQGTRNALYSTRIISTRAELLEAGEIVDEAAFDPYIFLREAYLQRRKHQVYDGTPPANDAIEEDEEIDIFSDE